MKLSKYLNESDETTVFKPFVPQDIRDILKRSGKNFKGVVANISSSTNIPLLKMLINGLDYIENVNMNTGFSDSYRKYIPAWSLLLYAMIRASAYDRDIVKKILTHPTTNLNKSLILSIGGREKVIDHMIGDAGTNVDNETKKKIIDDMIALGAKPSKKAKEVINKDNRIRGISAHLENEAKKG